MLGHPADLPGRPERQSHLHPPLASDQDALLLEQQLARAVLGGEAQVAEHARVPVIKHYKGVCHAYVHAAADLDMAERIVENAKVSRPGVCNALETLLVDREIAATFIPRIAARLAGKVARLRIFPDDEGRFYR